VLHQVMMTRDTSPIYVLAGLSAAGDGQTNTALYILLLTVLFDTSSLTWHHIVWCMHIIDGAYQVL
jgi:hypothetical protein